jgi:hypothetical protein
MLRYDTKMTNPNVSVERGEQLTDLTANELEEVKSFSSFWSLGMAVGDKILPLDLNHTLSLRNAEPCMGANVAVVSIMKAWG